MRVPPLFSYAKGYGEFYEALSKVGLNSENYVIFFRSSKLFFYGLLELSGRFFYFKDVILSNAKDLVHSWILP